MAKQVEDQSSTLELPLALMTPIDNMLESSFSGNVVQQISQARTTPTESHQEEG